MNDFTYTDTDTYTETNPDTATASSKSQPYRSLPRFIYQSYLSTISIISIISIHHIHHIYPSIPLTNHKYPNIQISQTNISPPMHTKNIRFLSTFQRRGIHLLHFIPLPTNYQLTTNYYQLPNITRSLNNSITQSPNHRYQRPLYSTSPARHKRKPSVVRGLVDIWHF